MSTPTYVDSETITQAARAQSSRVSVPLPDDPYVAVRKAQLVNTDTKLDPEEAPSKVEESQPLGSRVPLMSEEFEAFKPSTDLIPRHVSPNSRGSYLSSSSFYKRYSFYETPSPSSSQTLPVRKRYIGTSKLILDIDSEGDELGKEDTEEDEVDESSNADDERESHGLDDEGQGLDEEGQGLDDEGQGLDDEGQGLDDEGQGLEDEGLRME
ncbi:hypothetical protein Tco_0438531 [Tanacetum coccineum]